MRMRGLEPPRASQAGGELWWGVEQSGFVEPFHSPLRLSARSRSQAFGHGLGTTHAAASRWRSRAIRSRSGSPPVIAAAISASFASYPTSSMILRSSSNG
jgi:hypothetical protein